MEFPNTAGIINFDQTLGDPFQGFEGIGFQLESQSVAFDFAGFVPTFTIYKREADNTTTEFPLNASIDDDSTIIIVQGNSSDLPDETGIYKYQLKVEQSGSEAFTLAKGTISIFNGKY